MEWNKPERWTRRVVKRFAFFPKRVGNRVKWLEMCYIEQRYIWGNGFLDNDYWQDIKFVTEEIYLKENNNE